MRAVLLAVAILLVLGTLAALGVSALHFWQSSGPPVPQPKDVFFQRAWIDLGAAVIFAIGAAIALRARRKPA